MAYVPDKQLQAIGDQAIAFFHSESAIRFSGVYKLTLSQLHAELEKKKGGKTLSEGLGLAITSTPLSMGRVADAMKELSKQSQGKIPTTGSFFSALKNESQNFRFENLADVSLDIIKDAVEKAAAGGQKILDTGSAIGDSAISIGKNLNWILPGLIAIVVAFFAYSYSRKI